MRKLASIAVLIGALALAGCNEETAQLIRNKYNVPQVPEQLYNCPIIQKYPAVATLTDSQVAKLLIQLRTNNLTCKASLEGVRKFLDNARRISG
jgi:hypothetical protein